MFIDCVNVKIRDGNVANRPIYVALAVTCEGTRDILGLWAGEHGDGEGAKYWMRVLSEIKNRGTRDCLIVVCDGLKGLPEAIGTVVAPDRRANVYCAFVTEFVQVRFEEGLGGDRRQSQASLHRALGASRAGRLRRVQ
jgi:transposase-like protein